jgi:carbon-monoxide dehydrogenase small subunit
MVMAAISLIDEHGTLDEAEIRKGLEGNFCRCTGYQNIIKAIERASGELAHGRTS